jgi:ElaA protein
VHWQWSAFDSLTPRDLHAALALRAAAFVVEQRCAFLDPDAYDADGLHLLGWLHAGRARELVAYLRLLPSGKYAEPSIGRVVTALAHRRSGLGRAVMLAGMERAQREYPGHAIRIGAQQHLERFYASLGFARSSAPYDEDGIAHIEMLWQPPEL